MIEPTFTKMGLDAYHVTNTCIMPGCGHVTKGDVEAPQVFQWRQGASVQAAFPQLSTTQREALFVSGICGFCWDSLYPPEDEDYEDTSLDDILAMEEAYSPYDADYAFYEREGRPRFPNEY